MATEIESPAREPATRGRGRGGRGSRGGRGRGGGRGAFSAGLAKAASAKPGRGGTRRGRAKNFSDSRVQAAYERQRELKATYQAVAHALKPALQELAERSIDEALQNPDLYKQAPEHMPAVNELQRNFDKRMAEYDRRLQCDLELAQGILETDNYVTEQEFQNGLDELEELFLESQANRTRILDILSSRELPVDICDDQYEYKVISDEHFDKDFGIYQCYKNGHLVPYPSRVEGTDMWQRVRDADAAVAAAAAAAPAKAKGRGRGVNKRKAQEQPDGQPTPKKSTRGVDDGQLLPPSLMAPAPAKGLLASAAEVDEPPEGTPADEESLAGSPEPPGLMNGLLSAALAKTNGKLLAREKSPPLPKNAAEPDEYGFRIYNQRPSLREKWVNSRLLAPRIFDFNGWEIGFRDSSNDSSKGHTRAKRGKYLDTPNSNGMHFDHWCNGYDYSVAPAEDYDQDVVKRHGIHPTFGIFMPTSTNDSEENDPYNMPGKPIVYIANPSGRISHASRSFQTTLNHRNMVDAPWRTKVGSSMRRFCKMSEIDLEVIDVTDALIPEDELRSKSLGTALQELEGRPRIEELQSDEEEQKGDEQVTDTKEGGMSAMSVLTYATAFVEAQGVTRVAPPTPKPARYDAIRDVFTDSKPAPAPDSNSIGLNFLAELCNVETRLHEPAPQYNISSGGALVPEPDMRTHAFREEPPPASMYHQMPHSSMVNHADQRSFVPNYPHGQVPLQQPVPAYGAPLETLHYPPPAQDVSMQQPPPMRGSDYNPHAPPAPAPPGHVLQEPGMFVQHSNYPVADARDNVVAPGRPVDPGYAPSRLGSFSTEPTFTRPYWAQPQPSGPSLAPGPSAAPPPPPQHYPPPPSTQSRIPFSHTASAEPLPPLRPPRARNHSLQEEPPMHDSRMRPSVHGGMSTYYPPGPPRSFHSGYPGPEPHGPPQSISSERILPNPQQTAPSYMTSPRQSYPQPLLSPTFGNQQSLPNPLVQSPPGTPHSGPPSSAHRHRSTPSGDANNKYRKLQPAPVPAHRVWSNKPELKTIPYDHKESGGAALPSSGPTQIRGWNVNQHRKRSKADKNDRADLLGERDDSR